MKKTSGALLTSVLALTLCFVMLLGTTWAWFTDEVTSAGNIIQAGTLKIDLEHLTDPANDGWTSIKDNPDHKVFNYTLWEPGYTQYETLRITNEDSTLALKFRLNAVVTANAVLGKGGENLADVIDVYVAPGVVAKPASFDAILEDSNWRNAGTLTSLMQDPDGVAYGIIVPNWDHDYNLTAEEKAITVEKQVEMTFALHMREEAGNEYQGLSVGDISLNLFATQYTYEDDSFDDLYDDGLEPVGEGSVLVEEDGIQYEYTEDGEVVLYLVTEDFVGDTVNIPENVTKIGGGSFSYNKNIKTVNIPGTIKTISATSMQKINNIETINLGEGVEVIEARAFNQCLNLKNITLPSTLKTIEYNAFRAIAIEELTIPAGIETLGEGVFRDCPNLKKIVVEGSPKIGNYAFRSIPSIATIYFMGADTEFTGTSQIVTHNDTGSSANYITVYCYDKNVADRLVAANASGHNYIVKSLDGTETYYEIH